MDFKTDLKGEFSRRGFLAASAGGLGALGAGLMFSGCRAPEEVSPPKEVETPVSGARPAARPTFKLGLDTYTLHRSLTADDPANRRDIWWVIDRLGELGLDGLQIDPSHFPGDDESTLSRLEAAVKPRGYYLEFGMGGWDVTRLAARIRLTARFGGRAVRTFCGDENTTRGDARKYADFSVPALRHAAGVADAYGVDIAVENHGDFTSKELKDLLDRVGHPRVGACLDTANSLFRREDPLECARRLAPYARSMHLKDWTVTRDADGRMHWEEAVPGTGQVPLREILDMVAAVRPDLYIALEEPVRRRADEAQTVEHEWRHLEKSAAAARRLVAMVDGGRAR